MVVAILRCVTIHTGINTDNKLKTTHTPKTNTNKAGCNNKPPSRLIPDNSTSPLPNNHTRPSQTKTHENRYHKIPPKKTVSRFSKNNLTIMEIRDAPYALRTAISVTRSCIRALVIPEILIAGTISKTINNIL